MSILTATATKPLHVWERRTFDFSWVLYTDAAATVPEDLTGWLAWLSLYGADIASPVLVLAVGGVAPTALVEGTTGVILGGALGTIRAYCTNEDAAVVTVDKFTEAKVRGEPNEYRGRYELTLENPAGERYPYEVGDLLCHPTPPLP